MGVNFGCFDIGVTHDLLNDSDVNTIFEQMRSKTVPKSMATYPFTIGLCDRHNGGNVILDASDP